MMMVTVAQTPNKKKDMILQNRIEPQSRLIAPTKKNLIPMKISFPNGS